LKFQRPYGSYVMENVLFKISYPASFTRRRGGGSDDVAHRGCARQVNRGGHSPD